MISCLVLRIATILQYNEQVGPLIKIVGKMLQDFFNFVILYFILTIMFALVGNINFLYDVDSFNSFFNAILTVIDACLGNFDFEIFNNVREPSMQLFGQVYVMLIVITFNIMLLNLIIAILANTYNIFDTKSNGLYLSKILSTRDELTYDHSYGVFLSAMPPINFIQFPFIPMSLLLRYSDPKLMKLNKMIMLVQYTCFMLVLFSFFIVVSAILIPFAWLAGIPDKIKSLGNTSLNIKDKVLNAGLFLAFGPLILFLDLMADMFYFWVYNFRIDLHKIIIEKEQSSVTHRSLKEIMNISNKYSENKIKTAYTSQFIKNFRAKLSVVQNIQFLLFGQLIPEGGFRNDTYNQEFTRTFKSMKTQEMKEEREAEIKLLDDTAQYLLSKEQLNQFNQVKKILMNFAFKDK